MGALTAVRGDDDPSDPVAAPPARRLRLGPGLLGRLPGPVGPVIERHGSARPRPWDRFAG